MRAVVGNIEQRLIRRERDAIGETQPRVHFERFTTAWAQQPDAARIVRRRDRGIREVNISVVSDDDIVAAISQRQNRRASVGLAREHIGNRARHGKQAPVRPEGLARDFLAVGIHLRQRAIETDPMRHVAAGVVEENFAARVHGRRIGILKTFADELPAFASDQERRERGVFRRRDVAHGLGPTLPEPADRIGEKHRAVFAAVRAFAPDVAHVVTRKN